jgi:hypothetical protein
VDVQAGPARLLAQAALDFDVRRLAFLPDGALAAYGRHSDRTDGLNPETRVAVLDGETLSEQWQAQLPAIRDGQYADLKNLGDQALHDASVWWTPAAVFAPDASRLYVLHADSDTLTTVDFSKRSTTTAAVAKPRSFLQRLLAWAGGVAEAKMMNGTYRQGVLSADGTRLYTVGRHTESAPDQNGNL